MVGREVVWTKVSEIQLQGILEFYGKRGKQQLMPVKASCSTMTSLETDLNQREMAGVDLDMEPLAYFL